MIFGYARVSTDEQNLDLQRRALKAAGCERIVEERISGAVVKRPGLERLLTEVGQGDILIVWRLDRLGRSLQHLIEVIQEIGTKGGGLRSLSDSIDTTNAGGRLYFHMMGALAEFERDLIRERTRAGMSAARERGEHLGRKPALTLAQIDHARLLVEHGESPSVIARSLKVGRSTLYRALTSRSTHNGNG